MTSDLNLTGTRFPRVMLASEACERLLVFLGVQIVDECDAELEESARLWLAAMPVDARDRPAVGAVEAALARIDRRRAA